MYTGPGPGVTVPRIPTPTTTYTPTSMNIVKRSEIVTSPAKGTNNLESNNNNQTSNQVYLDNKEKNQNKSITSNDFSIESAAIDQLREKLGEALGTIVRIFGDSSGNVREEICGELVEEVEETMKLMGQVATIGREYREAKAKERGTRVGANVPSVTVAYQNMTNVVGESETRRALAGEVTMRIERPCDYCQQYTYLEKRGTRCSECEREKDYNYCMNKCGYCEKNRKAYNNADIRTITSQYVQIIKQERVEQMLARQPQPQPQPQPIVINQTVDNFVVNSNREMFNRRGNFVDKFLAVTYTLDVADMTRDNVGHLVRQLEDNFKKLTQIKDMECKGYIYVIEYTGALVPHLHGLVRMSSEKVGRVSASDHRFAGKNRIITPLALKRPGDNGIRDEKMKMLLKPINVEGWIAYMKKMNVITGKTEIKGYMGKIIEGWEYKESIPMSPF